MNDNIGSNIKNLVKIAFLLLVVFCVLGGIVIAVETGEVLLGILICLIAPCSFLMSAMCFYGFGHLIEKVDRLTEITEKSMLSNQVQESATLVKKKEVNVITPQFTMTHSWRCAGCGEMISESVCPHCGYSANKATADTKDNFNNDVEQLKKETSELTEVSFFILLSVRRLQEWLLL